MVAIKKPTTLSLWDVQNESNSTNCVYLEISIIKEKGTHDLEPKESQLTYNHTFYLFFGQQ